MQVAFFYLTAFKQTGGIEKFNRVFLKALAEISVGEKFSLTTFSCYDQSPDPNYLPAGKFKGFNRKKISFTYASVRAAAKMDVVIIGHINLAILGLLIKFLYPSKRLILIVHGIEVWNLKSKVKKMLLTMADQVLAVSKFTKDKIKYFSLEQKKIKIFYNTLDPHFSIPTEFNKPFYLLERYGISLGDKIILTVARLSGTELNKGYDKVIEVLPEVLKAVPNSKYMLCGKYSSEEKFRLDKLINSKGLTGKVILPGFISDEELTAHYLLADLFIMPSKKEGFGIVFIEALSCGLTVIAGNQDGSAEALLNGELGKLVNPDDLPEIQQAIVEQLTTSKMSKKDMQQKVLKHFGYQVYKQRLSNVLNA